MLEIFALVGFSAQSICRPRRAHCCAKIENYSYGPLAGHSFVAAGGYAETVQIFDLRTSAAMKSIPVQKRPHVIERLCCLYAKERQKLLRLFARCMAQSAVCAQRQTIAMRASFHGQLTMATSSCTTIEAVSLNPFRHRNSHASFDINH